MKILFFSPYFYPYTSGVTTYPQKILSYLSNKNKIDVLTFKYDKKLKNQEILNRYKITRIPYLFKISKGFIAPQSLIYFFKYVKNTNLIILNQPNFEGLFLGLIGKLLGKKIISIFHCQVFLEGNLFTQLINLALNISVKTQLYLSDKIIIYTKDYVDSLPYFKKFAKKTVDVLPPIVKSVEDKIFLNNLLKLKKNNIWIGYAGRISSEKGLEYLVETMKQLNNLPAGRQGETSTLVFAGPYGKDVAGENNYYNKIIKMLNGYKINYLFFGNLTSNQLSSFYKSIDLLVLPSINQTEAFGMVQAEAMITGTPVIASNFPGVRMPIRLTKMGIIVEPKNTTQITNAIEEIIKNKNRYANEVLIKKASNIFNINKTYKFYNDLINENS